MASRMILLFFSWSMVGMALPPHAMESSWRTVRFCMRASVSSWRCQWSLVVRRDWREWDDMTRRSRREQYAMLRVCCEHCSQEPVAVYVLPPEPWMWRRLRTQEGCGQGKGGGALEVLACFGFFFGQPPGTCSSDQEFIDFLGSFSFISKITILPSIHSLHFLIWKDFLQLVIFPHNRIFMSAIALTIAGQIKRTGYQPSSVHPSRLLLLRMVLDQD